MISQLIKKIMGDSLLWRLLRESVPEHRKKYAVAIVAMILVAVSTAGTAWIMGEIVNSMTDSENRYRVYLVAFGVAAIFFVKGCASYVQAVMMARAGNRIVAQKQVLLYRHLLEQGVAFFNMTESSQILMRVTRSAEMARNVIDTIVTGFVRDALTLVGLVVVMVYQQPVLSMVCLVVGPLAIFFVQKLLARVRLVMEQELAGNAEIIKVIQETAAGSRVVKAFALEDVMASRMEVAVEKVEKRQNKMIRLQTATAPLMDTITGVAIASIVLLSSASLFGQSAGSPGQLMSFVTAFLMAYEPAKRLSRMRVSIEANLHGVRMMYELLDQPQTMAESVDARDLPLGDNPTGLKFENVSFGYIKDTKVIEDLTLDFPAGQTTALVGPSGGGKSTVLNLILRLYDPTEGRITIDGCDLRDATFASLRQKIGYVGQDTFLFSNNVLENLRIARPDASEEEVYEAARISHADEFIRKLPKGYKTQIGENGAFLSGGQRQRLAIARAVLRRAPILLLDEATSALDSHSEALVKDAIEKITKGVTTIVVAHRLSTILTADQICYMENGRLVEVGSLTELLERNGSFGSLYRQQFDVSP